MAPVATKALTETVTTVLWDARLAPVLLLVARASMAMCCQIQSAMPRQPILVSATQMPDKHAVSALMDSLFPQGIVILTIAATVEALALTVPMAILFLDQDKQVNA